MLKQVVEKNQIEFNEEYFDVILRGESSFEEAFKTLNYILGETEENEMILVGGECNLLDIFREDGAKKIFFYSDVVGNEINCKHFIDEVLKEASDVSINIFICFNEGLELMKVNQICTDVLGDNANEAIINVISSPDLQDDLIKIVIGA